MFFWEFGENLKRLRKSRNMTQAEFGGHVGLSKAVISKYENGIGFPTLDVLRQIAEYYDVTADWLLGIPGEQTVCVTGLTESQIETVCRIIAEFRAANQGR